MITRVDEERAVRKARTAIERVVQTWVLDMDARVERGDIGPAHVLAAAKDWPDFEQAWTTWLEHGGTLGGRTQGSPRE